MSKISPLSLYVVNRVKFLRIISGIPAARLSIFLNHTPAYVFNIEKESLDTHYPSHEWPELATFLKCGIHDLLPPEDTDLTSTGELVEKAILDIRKPEDMTKVVDGLIDYGYFDEDKMLADLNKYLYIMKDPGQTATLILVLEEFTDCGKLIKNGEYFKVP